jgi:FkbM family methyltransferase
MKLVKKILLTIKTIKNWHLFVLDFFGFLKNKEIIYRLRNGLKFVARGGSTDAAEIVVVNGDLEYPKVLFKNMINPTILDIGANIGSFSVYASHILSGTRATIYALEPSVKNFDILEKNIKLNDLGNNIKASRLALYGKDGRSLLDIDRDYDAFYVIDNNLATASKKTEEVELMKLETFCSQNNIANIDLLKMDIEGGEYDVFYNSMDFIRTNVIAVFIEVHDVDESNNMKTFKEFILNNNFEIKLEISNNVLFLINKNSLSK